MPSFRLISMLRSRFPSRRFGAVASVASVAGAALLIGGATSAQPARASVCAPTANLPRAEVLQRFPFRAVLFIACVPDGQALSNVVIRWGDRTTSPGIVAYSPAVDGYVTAFVVGDHQYKKATCATSDQTCDSGYRVTATASDAQSFNFASTLQVLVFGRLRRR